MFALCDDARKRADGRENGNGRRMEEISQHSLRAAGSDQRDNFNKLQVAGASRRFAGPAAGIQARGDAAGGSRNPLFGGRIGRAWCARCGYRRGVVDS